MVVELTVARKRWERTRKASPTGEQAKQTCRFLTTRWMKTRQQFSLVSGRPRALVAPRRAPMMSSRSSGEKRSGMSPLDSRSFTYTSWK
jgi:hypothetical protein